MTVIWITAALGLWFSIELIVLYGANPSHFIGKFGKEERKKPLKEARLVAGRSLSLIGLSAAALAFLLNLLPSQPGLGEPLFLVVVALIFFLVSFKFEVGGAYRRAYYQTQSYALDFGLIAWALALALVYYALSPSLSLLPFALPAAVIAGHFWDLASTVRHYRRIA